MGRCEKKEDEDEVRRAVGSASVGLSWPTGQRRPSAAHKINGVVAEDQQVPPFVRFHMRNRGTAGRVRDT